MLIADAASDAVSIGGPVVGAGLLATMLKMLWDDRTRGERIERELRKQFAEERMTRELEVTAEAAQKKADFSETLIRHQQIHAREIATFQERITGYIEELAEAKVDLNTTKVRVSYLEEREKALTADLTELRKHG